MAGTALAACADSVWEPPGDGPGAEDGRPMAAVVSETAEFLADVDSLPSWRKVIEGMAEPGCAFHFRRVAGSYASKEYGLAYSRKATAKAEAWRALVYNVLVTVSRPAEGGGTEVLPERLAIRAVCAMPDTEWGTEEAKGRTEAILEAHGIKFPGAGKAQASADVRRALAALRRAAGRLGPRPLLAAQACENLVCVPITVTVRRPVKCSAGFDYEATTGECVRNTPGGSPGAGTPGNSGSSGGGNTNTNTNTGRRTVDFTLTCPTATRGASGTCSVSAPGEELGTLEFAWSSAAGGSVAKTPGKSSWSGTAVSEVTVTVTISDPAGAIAEATETDTADVAARDWTFTPPTPDSTSSGYGGANWHPGKWGQHDSGSTTTPGVLAGSGPWENLYTGDVAPVHNNDNGITLHNDFDANDAGHPGANRVSCFAAKDTSTVANVVAVNDACGTSSQLSSWEGMVLAHEADHAASGDRCLKSKKTADTIRDLEAITGDDVEEVRNELYETWNGFWEQTVLPAFEGRLSTPTSPRIWEYRFKGRWDRHKVTGGREGGTTSCR